MRPGKVKTAFVLAGGGSLGAVQVGMLRALVESGVQADLVVGSSAGAINAAYFAGDPTLDGISKLETLWRSIRRADIFPLSWRWLFDLFRGREYLMASDGLRRLLERHLPYRNLEEASVPVHVVATDVRSGEAVVLSRGSAPQALLASCALPAAFAPVEIDGKVLCDGAIASNTPIEAAVACGARRLIILPTGYACTPHSAPRGLLESASHAVTLLTAGQLVAELGRLKQATPYHLLPAASPLGVSPFDFSRTVELIAEGYGRTLSWLAEGGLERATVRATPRHSRPAAPEAVSSARHQRARRSWRPAPNFRPFAAGAMAEA